MSERSPSVEYRDIPDLDGYQAGTDGSIWTCWKLNGQKGTVYRRMKTPPTTHGYLQVNLKKRVFRVHVLIARTFLGPKPFPDACVRHFPDPDPTNNRVENLQYGTQKDNVNDSRIHGTLVKGERHGMSRFTPAIVLAMRADHAADPSEGWTSRLAIKYGTDPRTVHRIIKRIRWSHI